MATWFSPETPCDRLFGASMEIVWATSFWGPLGTVVPMWQFQWLAGGKTPPFEVAEIIFPPHSDEHLYLRPLFLVTFWCLELLPCDWLITCLCWQDFSKVNLNNTQLQWSIHFPQWLCTKVDGASSFQEEANVEVANTCVLVMASKIRQRWLPKTLKMSDCQKGKGNVTRNSHHHELDAFCWG